MGAVVEVRSTLLAFPPQLAASKHVAPIRPAVASFGQRIHPFCQVPLISSQRSQGVVLGEATTLTSCSVAIELSVLLDITPEEPSGTALTGQNVAFSTTAWT